MSSHCNKYPGCGCGPDVGTQCYDGEYDQKKHDQINAIHKELHFEEFKKVHKSHGVFFICKETGAKGGYLLPNMLIPAYITAERILFVANKSASKDLNESISYRPMKKEERKICGYKRNVYGKN